jgi:hypothetical protein
LRAGQAIRKDYALRSADDDHDHAECAHQRRLRRISAHAGRLTALPRVSINGRWQEAEALEILLTGAPFWLWNRGRRVAA